MEGGKSKYLCLYSCIKCESPKLFDIINETCLEGIFKSRNYKNTFLFPGDALIKKFEKMIADDKDEQVEDDLRRLFLKGHVKIDKHLKEEVANIMSKKLDNVSELVDKCEESKFKIFNPQGVVTTLVYKYKGDDVPKATENSLIPSERVPKNGSRSGGLQKPEDLHKVKEMMVELIDKTKPSQSLKRCEVAVATLLHILHKDDPKKLKLAEHVLSTNPILALYFLLLPHSNHSIITSDHLKQYKYNETVDMSIFKKVLQPEYSHDLFKQIHNKRKVLLNSHCGKSDLPESIVRTYNDMASSFPEDCKHYFSGEHINIKILQDELRFMYDNCNTHERIEDMINHVSKIKWDHPEEHFIICDKALYKQFIKPSEIFICGPVSFVKSIYFVYMPLNDKIESALIETGKKLGSNGIIGGGDPDSQSSLIYRGEESRQALKDKSEVNEDIAEVYHNLSVKQQEDMCRYCMDKQQ